jgi:hypothetical protein
LEAAGIPATTRYEYDDRVLDSHVVYAEIDALGTQVIGAELIVSLGPYNWADNPGDGSEANPLEISLASQMRSLADHSELWDRHFVLTADIDLSWLALDRALIAADANASESGFQGSPFNGTFDGAGHALAGLTITSSESFLGLFGAIGPAARIVHLYVNDVDIVGAAATDYVGPVAGIGIGEPVLEDCHTSGRIRGHGYLGELVGKTDGPVIGCTSTVQREYGSGMR